MFFENELPINHEPSLDRMAKAWATENVEEAKEEEEDEYSIVTNLSCPNCKCLVEVYLPKENKGD